MLGKPIMQLTEYHHPNWEHVSKSVYQFTYLCTTKCVDLGVVTYEAMTPQWI